MHTGKVCMQKCQWQQHATITTILALVTLGSLTQIGSFLFWPDIRTHLLGGYKSQMSNKLIADALIISTDNLSIFWIVCITKACMHKCQQQQHATVTTILALATLGSSTQIGSFLFCPEIRSHLLDGSKSQTSNKINRWCSDYFHR